MSVVCTVRSKEKEFVTKSAVTTPFCPSVSFAALTQSALCRSRFPTTGLLQPQLAAHAVVVLARARSDDLRSVVGALRHGNVCICCRRRLGTQRGRNHREADALAKGDVDEFNPALRFPVKADELMWNVLHEALEARRAAERDYQSGEEAEAAKARRTAQSGGSLVMLQKVSVLTHLLRSPHLLPAFILGACVVPLVYAVH